MIKAMLLDADGVTLTKMGYFSEIYSKEYNVPVEKITLFFKNEFRNCQLGKADIKEILPKYLQEWGWQKSLDDFLEYWFRNNTKADEQVLNKVQEIRAHDIKCYLATDQEKYRAEYIRKNLNFNNKIDGYFFSYELGCSKSESNFFELILGRLNLKPEEVLFLDDEKENIQSASQLGIKSKFYTGLSDLDYKNYLL